jgi:DNA-binding beta-propeller fold protein YncE
MVSRHYVRVLIQFAVLVTICVTSLSARPNGRDHDSRHTIWVVNRDAIAGHPGKVGDLAIFDADTGDVLVPSVPLGVGAHDVAISERYRRAFITNENDNTVLVLSTSTLELVGTIPFAPGMRPHHLETSTDGRTVYVGLFGSNRVALIDARTFEVREYASSAASGPLAHAPKGSPSGRRVFVPHENVNLLTKLSPRTGNILAELALGSMPTSGPSEVLPTRDGERLFVSMRNEGKISIVDTSSFTEIGEIANVGAQPESMILTPDEKTLIVSLRGSPAQLAMVSVRKREVLGTIPIVPSGTTANTFGDLAVASRDGRYVYATFNAGAAGTGGVSKVDLHKRTVQTWLYPRPGRPHGVAYSTAKLRLP